MGYEIDFLPVGDESSGGDAIALRYGNLFGPRAEQTVIVIDGDYTDDGEALVAHIKQYYQTDVIDTRGNTASGHGTSSPARRNWQFVPPQGKQAHRSLAVGRLRHLSATRDPFVTGGTTPHATRTETVTLRSPRPVTLYQQALRDDPDSRKRP
jgi:hypothetical protein